MRVKTTPGKIVETTKNTGVAAVDRAFAILAAFGPADKALSLAELAARTGMYKSTILRLMESLTRHGYLQRFEDGRYQIGPAPFLLGAHYQRNLQVGDIVVPLMRKLVEQTGESASLYMLHNNKRVCSHRVDSSQELRDHIREGDVFPLDKGSGGGLLSAFSGMRGDRYDAIRKAHYYVEIGIRDKDMAGISAPVFGMEQRLIGAITLSGPRSRVDKAFLATARLPLLKAAAQATGALGGDARPLEAALAAINRGKAAG